MTYRAEDLRGRNHLTDGSSFLCGLCYLSGSRQAEIQGVVSPLPGNEEWRKNSFKRKRFFETVYIAMHGDKIECMRRDISKEL